MDSPPEALVGPKTSYPRVLIVGQDFEEGRGGGVTLSCLFHDWPRDRIAVASQWLELGVPGRAGRYYRLGSLEDRWIWPLSAVPREAWKISGPVIPGAARGWSNTSPGADDRRRGPRSGGLPDTLGRRLGYRALQFMAAEDFIHGLHPSDSLLAWVHDFHPDVIYSQLSSLGLVRLVEGLARETGVPVVLHFMDDWPTTLYRSGLLAGHLRGRLGRELGALLDRAALLMVISDDMARAFKGRYGHDFMTFHNALDLGEWVSVRRTSWAPGHPFEILYAGSVNIANEAGILDVARATKALASDGMDVRLVLLTASTTRPVAVSLDGLAHVNVLPAIPHAEMPARLASADLLVLPLDFEERAQAFARFSMPTKTVEYMASGTPTLVYAPADNAVSRYAAEERWGHVVGTRSLTALTTALRLLAENPAERERLGKRAVELASARHDAGPVREAFRAALESIVSRPGTAR